MARKRYGEKTGNTIFRWLYFVIFGLISVWLISSIILKESPANVIRNIFSKMPGTDEVPCETLIIQKDSIIQELQAQLENFGKTSFTSKRGIVIIDSQTLNMRDKPSLSSEILMKIPANSEVEVLFFDSQVFYLEGLPGRWCKIKYAEQEGWVWGNYIKEI
ncbi:MAG: SH3 domain-containing protein [Saprospiraceae bacterium]|nr:SH3 domain-containing protein [Saprospiraceae bacterium]